MKIKTFRKLKDNRYKITFESEENIVLYDDIIVEYNLLANKELDDKKLKDIVKDNDTRAAYYQAIKKLNTKMRTRKEIYVCLKRSEYSEEVIEEVIEKLYIDGYLNDVRYIKAYVNDQINLTDKGPIKIKRELVALGFRDELAAKGLGRINDDVWKEKIDKYITKKLKTQTNLSAIMFKQKLITELINKGHYKDLITELIDNYEFKNSREALVKEYNKIKNKLVTKYEGYELRFHLKAKLFNKGFTSEEIESIIDV